MILALRLSYWDTVTLIHAPQLSDPITPGRFALLRKKETGSQTTLHLPLDQKDTSGGPKMAKIDFVRNSTTWRYCAGGNINVGTKQEGVTGQVR